MRSLLSREDWWITIFNRTGSRARAIALGGVIGVAGVGIGLGLALIGPVYMIAGLVGLLAGLYILTDLNVALYAVIVVLGLLPFGTLPFKIGLTPTLLDVALGAFFLVYLFQWMTGRRRLFQITPLHPLVVGLVLVLVMAFVLGLGHAGLRSDILRQFAEMLLNIGLALVLSDVIREEGVLRRVMVVFLVMAAATALIGIGLYLLPDATAESVLVRFAQFGYPNGGVIRYVEDNPALAERAIGVWIDPNAYGGVLAVLGAITLPLAFSRQTSRLGRWLIWGTLGLVGAALLLTYSRGALLSFGAGVVFIAVLRYRRLLWLMLAAGVLILILPVTQGYVLRMIEGFQVADLATQMRVGEITDALKLIQRYPVLGVGFAGTPTRDIYLGVANLYLTLAGNAGLVGLGTYLLTMAAYFLYGLRAWNRPGRPARFEALWLGTHAGILAALAAGVFDHYFFKLEFQPSGVLFWLVFGLGLATTRLWLKAEPDPGAAEAAAGTG